jgi:hypothetical protein
MMSPDSKEGKSEEMEEEFRSLGNIRAEPGQPTS